MSGLPMATKLLVTHHFSCIQDQLREILQKVVRLPFFPNISVKHCSCNHEPMLRRAFLAKAECKQNTQDFLRAWPEALATMKITWSRRAFYYVHLKYTRNAAMR